LGFFLNWLKYNSGWILRRNQFWKQLERVAFFLLFKKVDSPVNLTMLSLQVRTGFVKTFFVTIVWQFSRDFPIVARSAPVLKRSVKPMSRRAPKCKSEVQKWCVRSPPRHLSPFMRSLCHQTEHLFPFLC
jgi:hypothetical protein